MIEVDSRTTSEVEEKSRQYRTSGTPEWSHWGQPPITHYTFVVIEGLMYGQPIAEPYYRPEAPADVEILDSDLAAEFEAWEAASDEALAAFEAYLE